MFQWYVNIKKDLPLKEKGKEVGREERKGKQGDLLLCYKIATGKAAELWFHHHNQSVLEVPDHKHPSHHLKKWQNFAATKKHKIYIHDIETE